MCFKQPVTGECVNQIRILNLFIWLWWAFVAERGLSLVAVSGGQPLLAAMCGLLAAVASLAAGHRLQQLPRASVVAAHGPQSSDSAVTVHGLSCSVACGLFPDQDQTHDLCIGRWISNHWTTREVPNKHFFF